MSKTLSEETLKKKSETFKKNVYKRAEKEIGKKYNKLTVVSVNHEKTEENYHKHHGPYCDCICDCGNIKTYRLNAIKTGNIKSCGCIRFNNPNTVRDITGMKFGRLIVIGRDVEKDYKNHLNGKKGTHWLCQCECGNIISTTGDLLKSGKTQSCGCYFSEILSERNKRNAKKNEIINNNDGTITIIDEDNHKCLIDEEDYDDIKNWYWRKIPKRGNIEKGYWTTNTKIDDKYTTSIMFIHQIIARKKYGEYDTKKKMPDHLSRNTDDNRKCNISLKDAFGNSRNRGLNRKNTSGKTGVRFEDGMWHAYITVNYNHINLGFFNNFEDAVAARKDAEHKYGFTCDDEVSPYDVEVVEQ